MRTFFRYLVVASLTMLARVALRVYKPSIVAITGSVGKTSTKDAVFTVLASHVRARKSEKSYNSEIGVPLTVLGLANAWSHPLKWFENLLDGLSLVVRRVADYPEWLVLEVGADHPGDITKTASWLKPNCVVLTRFPEVPVHIEFFGSREAVIEEKRELRRALRENGVLIVNADDPIVREEPVRDGQRRLRYGFAIDADVCASNVATLYRDGRPEGIHFSVAFQDQVEHVALLGTLGVHQVYPLLAAIAVGISEGYRFTEVVTVVNSHVSPPGRMRIIAGRENSTIVDDTYNSSPVAVEQALATIASLTVPGKKIALLGDMMELGSFSVDEHVRVGAHVAQSVSVAYFVGIRMKDAALAACTAGLTAEHVLTFPDAEAAAAHVAGLLAPGDVVLVKGSQSVRMERAVRLLMREPERASELLVRQDDEWLARV